MQRPTLQPTLLWYNLNSSVNEVVYIVQIHGNYCGPNWTHGRAIPASRYSEFPEVTPIDALDRACQAHDKDCSKGGCSTAGDKALRNAALMVAIRTTNPVLRSTALLIAGGMTLTSSRRDR